jgi:hypothetical protein
MAGWSHGGDVEARQVGVMVEARRVRGAADWRCGEDAEAWRCFRGALSLDTSWSVSVFIPLYQVKFS